VVCQDQLLENLTNTENYMNKSESIKNLALALNKVQSKLTFAKKDSKNPFFKSNYADLESVWDACRDLLAENGLSVSQFPGSYMDGEISLTTILMHGSGEFIEQEMSLPVTKTDPQGAGSAITYMRRYALAAVIGIVQADDDANEASKPVSAITPQQISTINDLLEETETDVNKFLEFFKKQSIAHLDKFQASNAISMLEKKAKNVSQ
jgi:hypothetical protein